MSAIATLALSRLDTLLLQAALLEGEPARAAYGALRRDFDLDGVDYGRQRLLPLLHRNLTALGIDDPRLGRLRGIRHYHWAKNQMRMKAAAPVLAALHRAGAPVILLKGAALIAAGLGDMSLRPMDDIDILVRPERRDAAFDALLGLGFRLKGRSMAYVRSLPRDTFAGCAFEDRAGMEIDLHWYLLHAERRPGVDEGLWLRRTPVTFAGQSASVLAPADAILHTVAHAAAWSPDTLLRWAADVAMIIRRAGSTLDWQPLVDEARARRIAPPIHDALAALRTHLQIEIPGRVLGELRRASTPLDRWEHGLRAAAPEAMPPLRRTLARLFDFRRADDRLFRRSAVAAVMQYVLRRPTAPHARSAWAVAFYLCGRPRWLRRMLKPDSRLASSAAPRLPAAGVLDPAQSAGTEEGFIDGWSQPEADGRWSISADARVGWRLPDRGPFDLEIEGAPFWAPRGAVPRIEIWANDRLAGVWRGAGDGKMRMRLRVPDGAVLGRDRLIVTIADVRSRSPADRARSVDLRPLHVFVRHIALVPAAA